MKKTLLVFCLAGMQHLYAQDASFSSAGNTFFSELENHQAKPEGNWSALRNPVNVSFASSSVRYAKEDVPATGLQPSWNTSAWRGERVHTQLLVWTNRELPAVSYTIGKLTGPGQHSIPAENISAGFIRYVMTDEFAAGCSNRKPADFDSSLAPDAIDIIEKIPVRANTVQPVWLTVKVPQNSQPGKYSGKFIVHADKTYTLTYSINVKKHTLPPAGEWAFDLDLWQHPVAISRIHNVPRWSDEHFKVMKPYYTMLAEAGQKVITASIMEEPWGHQTYDDFPSLIKWTKKRDGSWKYDYSLFDKYVSFVMSCGIKERISCYSMIPWAMSFRYYDEALGSDTTLVTKTDTPEYTAYWSRMLQDFTRHLKEKGWFGITAIAMDERPMKDMQNVIRLIKDVDPGWKISLAGAYHPEIEKDIYDYCIASESVFDPAILKNRLQQGKPSTYYTCCAEKYPNGFTFSPPDENVWIGWYAAAEGFTGYLRWAYNSWVADPLQDSRFRTWPAGDTYQIYPGPRSSIRFEKLIEGIQDFEKIRIIRREFTEKGKTSELEKLDAVLAGFKISRFETETAEDMISKAKKMLGEF